MASLAFVTPILSFDQPFWAALAYIPPLFWVGLSGVLLGLSMVLRRRLWPLHLLALGVMFLMVSGWVMPRVGGGNDGGDLKMMTLNTLAGHADYQQVADEMKSGGYGVICFQEVAPVGTYFLDHFEELMPGWTVVTKAETAIASKYPLEDVRFIEVPTLYKRNIVSVKLVTPKGPVRLICTHFTIPVFRGNPVRLLERIGKEDALRRTNLELLMTEVNRYDYPVIVAGDFNTTPMHGIYRSLGKEMSNAFETAGSGFGYTYSQEHSVVRIDHIWTKNGAKTESCTVGDGYGSDHRSVTASIDLP